MHERDYLNHLKYFINPINIESKLYIPYFLSSKQSKMFTIRGGL